ncbi:hypothetical protein D2A34_17620 [Clostridium chromiireducens]|uniref:Uncharacterized protein n=1 Tax=Clostridium chromiireducens TaxID=225345 RepID=A0A399IPZ9_9CLOT|nr:hypothetical protein [Clostridium chromiireducens]RII33552.1 hypothetical protein D2A34_17620 [Clostridium chromiireducens]
MFLFDRNKLKMRSEEDEEGIKTFIEYHGIKEKNRFREKVLNELIGANLCLAVLDSRLLFFGNDEKPKITFEEIIKSLDSSMMAYKKIEIKKIPEVSMFGLTVKKGSKKTDKDYVIGFILNKDNFKIVKEYINKFNMYYFIDRTGLGEEILLQKLEENYEEIDELGKEFYCHIFNNNFNYRLVVLSGNEAANEIKDIVNKCHSEL